MKPNYPPAFRRNHSVELKRPARLCFVLSVVLLAAAGTLGVTAPIQAETWTDATGKFQVVGDFLALRNNVVYLRKENGVTIAVPMERLSLASQQTARQMAAAAGTSTSPDAALRDLMAKMQSGDFRAAWDSLPATYQTDVNEVVQAMALNMDADVWNAGKRILGKAVSVLKDKKDFIMGYPALQQPGLDLTAANKNWDAFTGLLDAIVNSDLTDLDKLKTFDGSAFMEGPGKAIGTRMMELAKSLEQDVDPASLPVPMEFPGLETVPMMDFSNVKISTVRVDGDSAVLRLEQPDGKVEARETVRVEGKWVPKEMADGWKEGVEQSKLFLTTVMPQQLKENKPMLLSPLSPVKMFEGVLDQLLAANDQAAFNEVIDGIVEMVGGMMGAEQEPGIPGEGEEMTPFADPPEGGADDPFGAPPAGGANNAADPFGN
ncbi:MAG: hypothetical protein KJ000_19480 [Pirellulaceae bacterium]|nr:hypothetical protein [Pirellulaceae bacterium]